MERARLWRWEWLIIGLVLLGLFALGPPLLIGAREQSHRSQCGNNLKRLTLGLQNYHDTFLYLPSGARVRTTGKDEQPSMGPSWLLATIPFWTNENNLVFDRTTACHAAADENDYASAPMLKLVDGKRFTELLCAASPLPPMELVQGSLLTVPSYVGLMGADPRQVDREELHDPEGQEGYLEHRFARGISNGDHFSAGGMLLINEALTLAACTDGTANTFLLSETSNWFTQGGQQYRVDGSSGGSWLSGTDRAGFSYGEKDFAAVAYNVTALRYPCNLDGNAPGAPKIGVNNTGIAVDHGANNPLLSAHPGGVMFSYLDGHVQLISNATSVITLKRLATRDEGGVICDVDEDQFQRPKPMSAGNTDGGEKSTPAY